MDDTSDARAVCPMCGAASVCAFSARDRNREVTPRHFTYYRCTKCDTIFLSPVPSDLPDHYRGGYPFDADGQPLWLSNPQRALAESARVELLKEYVNGETLIDMGAGSGGFSAAAKGAGFEVTAIEMDPQCCAYLEREIGVATIRTDDPIQALGTLPKANAIVLWHVLEHMQDALALLERSVDKLEEKGILAIAVPNPRSLQFRLMRTRWAHLDAPRHLLLVPSATLIEHAQRLGMSCVAVTTTDPDGLECNLFGWLNAIRFRPAGGDPPTLLQYAALALRRVFAPIERRDMNGAAVTLMFRKES